MILDGVVKNITDYGAFVDLGGVDGLLHVTDIAWRRINHPSEALTIGQAVKVQVIRFNPETQRISLGMKQLMSDPWEGVAAKYPVQGKFSGRVTNITDYGAFVELEPGVEGLVHVVRDVLDEEERPPRQDRRHLAGGGRADPRRGRAEAPHLARPQAGAGQPVGGLHGDASAGHHRRGRDPQHHRVRPVRRPGPDIDGMVHMSDLSLGSHAGEQAMANYNKGDMVKAKVLDVDVEKERISLGIKQLEADPAAEVLDKRAQGRHRHLHRHQGRGQRHRGEGRRGSHRLHPPRRAGPRPRRPAPREVRHRREGGRQGHRRSTAPPVAWP